MNTLATKLTVTAAIAALICATPVSIDFVRSGAAGMEGTAHLALTLDTAHAAGRFGHGAACGGEAGAFHGGLRAHFGQSLGSANNTIIRNKVVGALGETGHLGQRDGTLIRRLREDDSHVPIKTKLKLIEGKAAGEGLQKIGEWLINAGFAGG
jgi:hypothetical protein